MIIETERLILRPFLEKEEDGLRIIGHPFEGNAECIVVYGNGDVVVDPCFESPTFQWNLGNLNKTEPREIFNVMKSRSNVWEDYLKRLNRSTLFVDS